MRHGKAAASAEDGSRGSWRKCIPGNFRNYSDGLPEDSRLPEAAEKLQIRGKQEVYISMFFYETG